MPASPSRRSFLAGLAAGSAALVFGDYPVAASGRLPRTTPEGVGIDPAGILAFIEGVDQKFGGLHSFMLLRRGQVAAEGWWAPYGPRHPHMLYSLSKSFCSTAVGLAVEEGLLKVEAPVVSFFPGLLPARVPDNLAAMQVKHLLMMGTGHERDATGPMRAGADGNWVKAFLSLPVEHAPGSRFVYNSAATYMCSAIVQRVSGKTVLDYLKPRLFAPLGIEGQTWETCPRGISTGGWGLSVKTEDIARFGQLYLQRGKWEGRQLVPESWVAAATNKQIANGTNPNSDWNQGYGYQFWRCRHGAYRGDGAFGQYCVVLPEQEAVLAITSGLGDMQAVLNLAWEHLLPAMKSAPSAGGNPRLRERLAGLRVPLPAGKPDSPTAARVSGKTFRFDANDQSFRSARLSFREGRATVVLETDQGERRIEAGSGEWVRGKAPLATAISPTQEARIASAGAWEDDQTYVVKQVFYETPYILTTTWKFDDDRVTVRSKMNVAFGPTERPAVTGRLA